MKSKPITRKSLDALGEFVGFKAEYTNSILRNGKSIKVWRKRFRPLDDAAHCELLVTKCIFEMKNKFEGWNVRSLPYFTGDDYHGDKRIETAEIVAVKNYRRAVTMCALEFMRKGGSAGDNSC
jgi:hypothetical protein